MSNAIVVKPPTNEVLRNRQQWMREKEARERAAKAALDAKKKKNVEKRIARPMVSLADALVHAAEEKSFHKKEQR